MLNITLQFSFFGAIAIAAIIFFFVNKTFKKINVLIALTLFALWTIMYLQKDNGAVVSKIHTMPTWVFPIVFSLYQFTQAITRVPLGKLSQKLNSRKQVVIIVGLGLAIGVVLLIASNLAIWAIIIAAILSGTYGATFGLDAQFTSEHWDIKKVFRTSALVFVIPVAAKFLAGGINDSISEYSSWNDMYRWFLLGVMVLVTITVVLFVFFKEDPKAFKLDNMADVNGIKIKRGKIDIAVLAIAVSLLAFMYSFITTFARSNGVSSGYMTIIALVSLGASMYAALHLVKKVRAEIIRKASLAMVFLSFITIGTVMLTGNISKEIWMVALVVASLGFGTYVMVLFGSALHFDHKYPALVLGVFLSAKSFSTGLSVMVAQELVILNLSQAIVGGVILGITLMTIALIEINQFYYFIRKGHKLNTLNTLVTYMVEYEKNSSKLVISNK